MQSLEFSKYNLLEIFFTSRLGNKKEKKFCSKMQKFSFVFNYLLLGSYALAVCIVYVMDGAMVPVFIFPY